MGIKRYILAFLMVIILAPGFAQVISRKAQREKNKIERISQIDSLMSAKTFVFEATRAFPQGWKSVDLTTNSNYIRFSPDKIDSYMPFFGRAYSVDYNGDAGIKFTAKPEEYKIVTLKNGKGYEIEAAVSAARDNYKLTLFVDPQGGASLTINSNQRASISYNGTIGKLETPKAMQ